MAHERPELMFTEGLLDGYRLRKITWLVYIGASHQSRVIGEKLQGNDVQDG